MKITPLDVALLYDLLPKPEDTDKRRCAGCGVVIDDKNAAPGFALLCAKCAVWY